ncbi:DUF5677 domain-containing protein [Neolewinella litorea]|uniref:Uncharacterized protein n=1 Tax=Neolewinella litorea TaxID=2562452 RepID=A0A4S4NAL7_9BACT|nr:DUF5677 domain-containing protein [Neolewinella litorea]THH36384.1 hypothetical protein E4021_14965 [Neolewinella litorea]
MDKNVIGIKDLVFSNFEDNYIETLLTILESLSAEQIFRTADADGFEVIMQGYDDFLAELTLDHHNLNIDKFVEQITVSQKRNINRHRQQFENFVLLIELCKSIFEIVIDRISKYKNDLSETLKVAISLYGLILRKANQIFLLLMSGQEDAAMAVWRSLYETTVVYLVLVTEDDEVLTKKFVEHSDIGRYKKAISYQENHKSFNFPPLEDDVILKYTRRRDALKNKYGLDFVKSDYGWANDLFGHKTTFIMLESRLALEKFRPYYKFCSEYVHTNFASFFSFKEGNMINLYKFDEFNITRVSIVDPMQYTASLLDEVTDFILWRFSMPKELDANRFLIVRTFNRLVESLGEEE